MEKQVLFSYLDEPERFVVFDFDVHTVVGVIKFDGIGDDSFKLLSFGRQSS